MVKILLSLVINITALLPFVLIIFLSKGYSYSGTLDLTKFLTEYLKRNYPWAYIEVTDVSHKGVINELPERVFIERQPPGRATFLLEFKNNKKLTITANVRVFEWVVFCSRPMRKGEVLKEEDLYLALFDLEKIPKGSIRKIDEAVGKRLNRSINANIPITDLILNDQKQVKRGQLVSIVIESPHFIIRATGEIKENAYVGKTVRVINTASKRIITGVLVDENTVRVHF